MYPAYGSSAESEGDGQPPGRSVRNGTGLARLAAHALGLGAPRDPLNGGPVPFARDPADFAPRWYAAENDFLGDPFSSHVTRCSFPAAGSTTVSKTGSVPMNASIRAKSAALRSTAWRGLRRELGEVGDPWLGPDMVAAPRQGCRWGGRWRWTRRP